MRILITGGTRGIGLACVEKFHQEGCDIVTVGNHSSPPAGVSNHLNCDLTDSTLCPELVKLINSFKPNVFVHSAGFNANREFLNSDDGLFQNIFRIHVGSFRDISKIVLPHMIAGGWGRLVGLGSIWGGFSLEGRSSYSAAKAAVFGLTRSISIEYAKDGVLANCVSPGFIETEMTAKNLQGELRNKMLESVPMKRLGDPKEVAGLIYYLGSELNTFITGQNIYIDGGFSSV